MNSPTGILISAANRTQLMAYQMGTLTSFLPGFLLSVALVGLLFFSGIWYFRRTEKGFADVI